MQIPFKITASPVPVTPLVGSTNFQEHYAGVNSAFAWAELSPAIRQAVQIYLLPFTGLPIYTQIVGKYQVNDPLSDAEAQALEYLQDAAANYAVYHILPQKTALLTTLGAVQQSPEGGAQQTSQWSWHMKRDDALKVADTSLDMLLMHLEQRVAANDPLFDAWADDPAYKAKKSVFFRHTAEMDEYLNIKSSRRTFVSVIPFFLQTERRVLKPILCDTLYAAMQVSPLTAANEKLLPMIKEAVAYLGAAAALPHHRVVLDGDGFRVVSQTDGYTDRRNLTNNVHESAVQALLEAYQERGADAIRELKKFLEDNIDDYPDYRDSACREMPGKNGHSIIQSPDGIGAVLLG